jgi:hypothetical protein
MGTRVFQQNEGSRFLGHVEKGRVANFEKKTAKVFPGTADIELTTASHRGIDVFSFSRPDGGILNAASYRHVTCR